MHMKHKQILELGQLVGALRTLADELFITAPADARVTLLGLADHIEALPVYVDDDDLEAPAPADQPCHFAPTDRGDGFQDDPITVFRSWF